MTVYCTENNCQGHKPGEGVCKNNLALVCCGLSTGVCDRHKRRTDPCYDESGYSSGAGFEPREEDAWFVHPPQLILGRTEPAPTPTGSILEEAHRLTHGPRGDDYGHPLDDYTQTAALLSALWASKLKEPLTAHEAALGMVCVKLSREVRKPKRDNAVDGAGYFWVAHACLEEAARRANPSVTTTKE